MSSIPSAVLRASLAEAWVTLRAKYTSPQALNLLLWPGLMIAILLVARGTDLEDVTPLSQYLLAGFLAWSLVTSALMGVAGEVQTAREDGTLLRAKAVPHGVAGHLVTKLVTVPVDILLAAVPMVLVVAVMMPEILPAQPWRWGMLLLVTVLSIAAMMPWGAIFGSIFRSMVWLGLAMMLLYGVAFASGLFFPISTMWSWVGQVAQLTPIYWVGLAFRKALLPPEAAVLEGAQVWSTPLVLLVLVAWAVVGMVLATLVLRRMARRQSGSAVTAARDRVLARGY